MTATPEPDRRSRLRSGILALGFLLALGPLLAVIAWNQRHAILSHSLVQEWLLDQAEGQLGLRPQWPDTLELHWLDGPVVTLGAGAIPNPPGFTTDPLLAWGALRWVMSQDALRHLWQTGDLLIDSIELDRLQLNVETNASGQSNWQTLFPDTNTENQPRIRIQSTDIAEISIDYRAPDQPAFSLSIAQLHIDGLNGEAPTTVREQIRSRDWQFMSARLDFANQGWLEVHDFLLKQGLPANEEMGFDLGARWQINNFGLRTLPLPAWATAMDAPLVISAAEGSYQGGLPSKRQGELRVKSLRLDDVDVRGSVVIQPESVAVQMDIERLRLDPFWGGPDPGGPMNKPLRIEDLPFEPLREYGVLGDIRIGELAWRRDRLREIRIRLTP